MSRKSTLGDALAAHPSVDMLAPAIPIIIWAISGRPVPDDNVSQNLFVALSTLSGLVMAAVTFICSMSYQSESRYMQIARDRYHDELSETGSASSHGQPSRRCSRWHPSASGRRARDYPQPSPYMHLS